MKTTTLIVVMLMLVSSVFASDKRNPAESNRNITVVSNSPKKFKVVYLDQTPGNVGIMLKNSVGQVIYQTRVYNSNGFTQPYDLNTLSEGNYTFVITKPDGYEIEEPIAVKEKSRTNFTANVLNINGNKKFRLAVVSKDKKRHDTTVRLYNERYELIYEETIIDLSGFRKIYDLSQVPGTAFRFVVEDASGTQHLRVE